MDVSPIGQTQGSVGANGVAVALLVPFTVDVAGFDGVAGPVIHDHVVIARIRSHRPCAIKSIVLPACEAQDETR